jgi:hypothetical protein
MLAVIFGSFTMLWPPGVVIITSGRFDEVRFTWDCAVIAVKSRVRRYTGGFFIRRIKIAKISIKNRIPARENLL